MKVSQLDKHKEESTRSIEEPRSLSENVGSQVGIIFQGSIKLNLQLSDATHEGGEIRSLPCLHRCTGVLSLFLRGLTY